MGKNRLRIIQKFDLNRSVTLANSSNIPLKNLKTRESSYYRSNKLPSPTQNLVWENNDVLPGSGQFEPQFSYARTVKWENEALKWNPPYPVCQARFLLKD